MTEEERIIKMLDRLNKNSTYGLPKKDKNMSDIKPLVVVLDDRFNGKYSGGKWTAWNMCYVPSKIFSDAKECEDFFAKENLIFGRGETPEEAIEDLECVLQRGSHIPKEHIKAVSESTENKEDEKMEPTSVYRIEGINDIWINQDVDGMSLMLKNRDDLYKIVMTGDAIDNFNDKFVISPQADMIEYAKDMRKFEKENEELKAKSKYISNENALLLETNKKLKKENERNKENLNSQHEMIRELIQKNFKLKEENEQYKEAAERRFNEKLHDFEVNNKKYDGKIMEEILKRNSGRYPLDKEKSSADNVNHPSHYTGKYECIDVMQDVFGDESTNDFCLCNAFKYIWRARKKNGLEDVKKAVWYLNKYIEEAEKDGEDEVTGT